MIKQKQKQNPILERNNVKFNTKKEGKKLNSINIL